MIKRTRRALIISLVILFAAVAGSIIAELAEGSEYFDWLSFGKSFGISTENPLSLDLGIIDVKLGFMFNVTVSTVLCIMISVLTVRRL